VFYAPPNRSVERTRGIELKSIVVLETGRGYADIVAHAVLEGCGGSFNGHPQKISGVSRGAYALDARTLIAPAGGGSQQVFAPPVVDATSNL
jgi:hypothetical protein